MPLPGTSPARRLFCDTSFFYACFDPGDVHHERARELLEELSAARASLSVTWDVIGETLTLLRYQRGHRSALQFLDEVKPLLRIVPYGDRVREMAQQVFRRYGRDRSLSFCDAISFVVVTRILRNAPCLAFDEDFRALGLTVIV
jgi:predicted nucleic acid-binding protein